METPFNFAFALCVAALFLANSSMGQTTFNSVVNGNFASSTTWSPVGNPGISDNVVINHLVTVSTAERVNDLTINNNSVNSASLSVSGTGTLTAYGNAFVNSTAGQSLAAEILIVAGATLSIAGNLEFDRDNEYNMACRLYMTGGNVGVGGDLIYHHRNSQSENQIEINLTGNSKLSISGNLELYQDPSIALSQIFSELKVEIQGTSTLSASNIVWQTNRSSGGASDIRLIAIDDSNVDVINNVYLNQVNVSDEMVFGNAGNSILNIGGDLIIDKSAGGSCWLVLTKATIENNILVTKTGGNHIYTDVSGEVMVKGTAGILYKASGGPSSSNTSEFRIWPDGSLLIPNGSFRMESTNPATPGGSTELTINGNLDIGENLEFYSDNLNALLKIEQSTANVTIGSDLIFDGVGTTTNGSGIFITNSTVNIGNDMTVTMNNSTNTRTMFFTLNGAYDVSVGRDLVVNDFKGNLFFQSGTTAGSTGILSVGRNLDIKLLANTTTTTSLISSTFEEATTLTVQGVTTLETGLAYANTNRNLFTFKESANFVSFGDIQLKSRGASNLGFEFSNDAQLELQSTITRSSLPGYGYGRVLFMNQSSILLNGTNPQVIAQSNWPVPGTDKIQYNNIILNNTSSIIPQFTLTGDVDVANTVNFLDGIVQTASSAKIIFSDNALASGYNSGSFIDGPVYKVGVSDFTYPVGDFNGTDAVLEPIRHASIFGGDANLIMAAEYTMLAAPNASNLDATLSGVSGIEFWDIGPVTAHTISADVSLYWTDALFSDITSLTLSPQDLTFAHFNLTQWEDLGGAIDPGSTVGESGTGFITASMTSFSPVTFGTKGNVNPLPVTLIDFHGTVQGNSTMLTWVTASELNNHHYDLEKSNNGKDFSKILEVAGNGTTAEKHEYHATDQIGLGIYYYRLRQVNFDNSSSYSSVIFVENSNLQANPTIIFPNPVSTNGKVSIGILPGYFEAGASLTILIISLQGDVVLETQINNSNGIMNLDLKDHPINTGLYLITVSDSLKRFQTKLVIE